jgi:hypothetical protein
MSSYERVTYRPEGAKRARTVLLCGVGTSMLAGEPHLTGSECALDGDLRWINGGTTNRTHLITLSLVIHREPLRMDNTYGVLVPAT